MAHLTGICRSFYPEFPQVNNPLLIIHRVFTRYHTEIKRENEK